MLLQPLSLVGRGAGSVVVVIVVVGVALTVLVVVIIVVVVVGVWGCECFSHCPQMGSALQEVCMCESVNAGEVLGFGRRA